MVELFCVCLPALLVLVETDAARSERHDEQEAANDRHSLEEVVLEEVVERSRRVDCPERVGDEVEHGENENERERAQLGLVAHGHEDYESAADEVEQDVEEAKVHAHERQKHDDEEHATDELEVVLRCVVVESRHARKQTLGVRSVLDEQQDEAARQRQVAQKEAQVPEDFVRQGLLLYYTKRILYVAGLGTCLRLYSTWRAMTPKRM